MVEKFIDMRESERDRKSKREREERERERKRERERERERYVLVPIIELTMHIFTPQLGWDFSIFKNFKSFLDFII